MSKEWSEPTEFTNVATITVSELLRQIDDGNISLAFGPKTKNMDLYLETLHYFNLHPESSFEEAAEALRATKTTIKTRLIKIANYVRFQLNPPISYRYKGTSPFPPNQNKD